MNPIRAIRCLARILAVLASAVLASLDATPAALATRRPQPPGWNTHPPLPAHVHPPTTGGIPGWQLTLMAVTVVLLVATLVAIGYPGPARPAAGERTHRLSEDRIRRGTDPQEEPAAAAETPEGLPTGRNKYAPGPEGGLPMAQTQPVRGGRDGASAGLRRPPS